MPMLELVHAQPDWSGALGVALSRPPGVPERRQGEDPWHDEAAGDRPRRISDDLAWLRQAIDEPEPNGLRGLGGTAGGPAWGRTGAGTAPLARLRDRRVLDAAGFLLHE